MGLVHPFLTVPVYMPLLDRGYVHRATLSRHPFRVSRTGLQSQTIRQIFLATLFGQNSRFPLQHKGKRLDDRLNFGLAPGRT
jgi:hypothetical protein